MLWWIAQNLIVTTALAAVVFVLCKMRRLGPAGRHVLWTIVLIKLITPPLVFWPWSVPGYDDPAVSRKSTPQPATKQDVSATDRISSNSSEPDNAVVYSETIVVPRKATKMPIENSEPNVSEIPSTDAHTITQSRPPTATSRWQNIPWQVLWGVWIAGSVFVIMLNVLRIVRMQRGLRDATAAPASLQRLVTEQAGRLGIRVPPVRVLSQLSSPVIWAAGKPVLLWPGHFAADDNFDAWQGVVVHELAHLKRRDHWVGWLELLATAVWWWNPLFWYVRGRIHENAELACDAWVVNTLPDGRRAYAEALLHVCDRLSQTSAVMPAAPAVGAVSGGRRHLERRLTMILKETVPFRASWSVVLAVVVLGLLALPGWSQSKTEALPVAKKSDPAVAPTPGKPATAARFVPGLNNPLGNPERRTEASDTEMQTRALKQKIDALEKIIVELRAQHSHNHEPARDNRRSTNTRFRKNPATSSKTNARNYPLVGPAVLENGELKSVAESSPVGVTADNLPRKSAGQPVVATDTITLQRTTYLLPMSRAKALSEFLRQHIKAEVLHTEIIRVPVRVSRMVPENTGGLLGAVPATPKYRAVSETTYKSHLRITTTPEVQKMIGLLVTAMRKDEPAKTTGMMGGAGAREYDSGLGSGASSLFTRPKSSLRPRTTLPTRPPLDTGKFTLPGDEFGSGTLPGNTGAPSKTPRNSLR